MEIQGRSPMSETIGLRDVGDDRTTKYFETTGLRDVRDYRTTDVIDD
jgi:hypothetical protein